MNATVENTMVNVAPSVEESVKRDFPNLAGDELEAKVKDREAMEAKRKAEFAQAAAHAAQLQASGVVLRGVNASDIKFDDAVAETGKAIILKSIRAAAELTREVFLFMRQCEDEDYVEGTFKVAEGRALKNLRDAQEEQYKHELKLYEEGRGPAPMAIKPYRTLSDIAKIQGGTGAGSYIMTKSRLLKYMNNAETYINGVQDWYNFQAKHQGEPQMFVADGFMNLWSKRYADEKKGWRLFTADARLAELCIAKHESEKKRIEREKGKAAAAQTGQNGEQNNQGMASGTRQRGNLADSTQKCLNAVILAAHDAAADLEQGVVNAILSECAAKLREAIKAKQEATKAKIAETSSRPSVGIAESEGRPQAAIESAGVESSGSDAPSVVKPDWLDQADWDAADADVRQLMISEGKERYVEEKAYMKQHIEAEKDVESNEPKAQNE